MRHPTSLDISEGYNVSCNVIPGLINLAGCGMILVPSVISANILTSYTPSLQQPRVDEFGVDISGCFMRRRLSGRDFFLEIRVGAAVVPPWNSP